MIKNERTFPNYILLLLLWFFITFFSPSYQQEGYAREWPHLIPSVVIFLCNVLLFPAFRWYNHRDVKKQTEPQSLQSDRISPFLCRECGLIYLQAATLMLQFKVRHYDPSQQLNRKMAAFPNGCGHFLFFHIYKLKIWCYNIRWMITSQGLSLLEMTVLSGTRRSFFYLHRSTLMLLFKMRHYAPSQSFRRWLHSRTDVAIFFSLFT